MAKRRSQFAPDGPFADALRTLGTLDIVEQGRDLPADDVLARMRAADVVITNWASVPIPLAMAEDPGRLRYVLNLGGTCKATVPIELIQQGIHVTNWGDTPAHAVAEGAMSLFLAVLKDLRARTEAVVAGKCWGAKRLGLASGTVRGLRVGLYGCGVIGQRFVEMIQPFSPELLVYDPYVETVPAGCSRVDSLDALFAKSEAVVIWAGLSEDTRGSVTAQRLSQLPDHGILVNAARGEIVDQEALFAELRTGRLRAGLDVLVGDNYLPQGHEAHTWPNVLITCHDINSAHWPERDKQISYAEEVALANLKHFLAGTPLRFVVDERRYRLMS